jgi:hypothetical protein
LPEARKTDVLVVGAGPAGLSAAAACLARGLRFLVVEAGSRLAERNHTEQRTLGTGVGGSGLYSDGKFSFYPSATALWRVADRAALEASWFWFSALAGRFGVAIPALPDLASLPPGRNGGDTGGRKDYRSLYVCYHTRRQVIETLEAEAAANLLTGADLHRIEFDGQVFRCRAICEGEVMIEAKTMIHAGGRFAPIGLADAFSGLRLKFHRVEVGVRLEQEKGAFFLRDDPFLDPKLIWKADGGRYEWRTFCCCRDGEVVTTEVQGLVSVSGRADCPPTDRSNVGFNLRVTDPGLADEIWPDTYRPVAGQGPAEQNLSTYLENPGGGPIAIALGPGASCLLAEGLQRLLSGYPALRDTPCLVVAPAIEGVGRYPELADNLRCAPFPMWVAGDATGVFRGLTAAMVSGYFAALEAAAYLEGLPWN